MTASISSCHLPSLHPHDPSHTPGCWHGPPLRPGCVQAPEVIKRKGTTKAADYWAIGILIFEMLVGDPPFKSLSGDPWDTFRQALSGRFFVPPSLSPDAADIIYKLLQVRLLCCKLAGRSDLACLSEPA